MGQIFFPSSPPLDTITRFQFFPTCLLVLILALAERGQNILIYQESELQTVLNLLSKRMLPSYFSWQPLTATL